jgi:hypothetical protein
VDVVGDPGEERAGEEANQLGVGRPRRRVLGKGLAHKVDDARFITRTMSARAWDVGVSHIVAFARGGEDDVLVEEAVDAVPDADACCAEHEERLAWCELDNAV